MTLSPRLKLYWALATLVFLVHLVVGALATKPSFLLTLYADANPCLLLLFALLAVRENFRRQIGVLPLFWKLLAAGLAFMLLSQLYWFYFDWRRQTVPASPIIGDGLFLLAQVFFLSALALRPHSSSAGRNLKIRFLDLVLLTLWWFSLYGYFSLPWQVGRQDFAHYNPSYYTLSLIQHLVLIAALVVLCARNQAPWRAFYAKLLVACVFLAGGNLLLNVAISVDKYYGGSFYDTPFFFAIYLITPIAAYGPALEPRPDSKPNRELMQSVWTARFAMFGILSLPVFALLGMRQSGLPADISTFRLKVIFAAMLLLGALVYWKLNLLARELNQLVQLTRESIEKLNAVQLELTHSEKLVALGRLAAGAAHEISNPLTAIFGYSELLTEIPSLTQEDRTNAQLIKEQVRRAQAAVSSLRDSLRQNSANTVVVDKKPVV
ncbi:MAG TPA: histidine kinase dimerization/phospho-acceptor domain-containing protein [Verrucomicrobiae bacterium]|nr:histidine kinase dimerization/phospho-acceptor domain-containing protein [Verrucomicrobiae bacterium]